MKKALILGVFSIVAVVLLASAKDTYKVLRSIDGDTIEIEYKGKAAKVRLIGVDTPETVHPNKPVERYGKEASAFTAKLVEGKSVRIEFDQANEASQNRDKYGRLLAYVYLPDDTLLNDRIIRDGYGHAYTKYPFDPEKLDQFRAAEKEARENKRGMWADEKKAETKEEATPPAKAKYCASSGSKIFHYCSCSYVDKIKSSNMVTFSTRKEAVDSGRRPCKRCKP